MRVTDVIDVGGGAFDVEFETYCTDDQVANVAWCGTTVASLKTCLQTETDDAVAATILALYGP